MTDILSTLKNPYIYRVTNFETGRYYIGSQCSGKTIGVNYFTSSTNKEFKEDFKKYGEEKYEITIIGEFTDPEECVNVENLMIMNSMQLKDGLCLNRSYRCGSEKIFSVAGHPSWKKGIPLSGSTKLKMSLAHKIKISIEGTVFDSLTEAAQYYNVCQSTITYWLKTNKHNAVYIKK